MKGLMIFSNGMEDNEALSTLALLRRAKFVIDTVTYNQTLEVKTGFGLFVKADYLIGEINLLDYDFLIVPGGGYVAKVVEGDTIIRDTIKQFSNNNKLIGAICYAPAFLGIEGLLDNKEFTSYPGSEKYMPKGKYLKDQKVVVSGNIITARSAGAVIEFVYQIVKKLSDEAKSKALLADILY